MALGDMKVADVGGELVSKMEKLGSLVALCPFLCPAVASQAIGLKD